MLARLVIVLCMHPWWFYWKFKVRLVWTQWLGIS